MNDEDALDGLAAAVFGSPRGRERLAPLLRRYVDEVGQIREDDDHRDLLQAVRTDWALCDAPAEDDGPAGDTWLLRVVTGALDQGEVERPQQYSPLVGSFCGLFEVWPGTLPWLRDWCSGICVPLGDPVRLEPSPQRGPAALWEVRIRVVDGLGLFCRPPLPYPLQIVPLLEELHAERWSAGGPRLSLQRLRRVWLQFHRAPRADPQVVFERGLAASARG